MKLKSFEHFNCSLAQTLSVIGEHWTLLIIRDAFFGLQRFDQFHNSLGISRNVLSDRLKKLVQAGVLDKSDGPGHPEYRLTKKGRALQPAMLALTHWGDTYMPHPDGDRITFADRNDGKPIKPMGVYAQDGRRLNPEDVEAKLGPGVWNEKRVSEPDAGEAARRGLLGSAPESED